MNIDWSHITPPSRGPWLALADDELTVLGSGKTPAEALAKAQKKQPVTVIITHLPVEDPEIPNDNLIAAMKAADEYERSGNMKFYSTVDEMMAALE